MFFKQITLYLKLLLVSCFLLLSSNVFAFQETAVIQWQQVLAKVEQEKNTSPAQALTLLQSLENSLSSINVDGQIKYYQLKSKIYLDQYAFARAKKLASIGIQLSFQLPAINPVLSELYYIRGFAIESLGDFNAAVADYSKGLALAESLKNQEQISYGLLNLGAIYYLTEKYDASLSVLNRALKIANGLANNDLLGNVTSELGILYSYLGQQEQSLNFHQRSFEHFNRINNHHSAITSLINIANNHATNKRYNKAISIYKQILNDKTDNTNDASLYVVYSGMAWAQLRKKDSDIELAHQYILIAGQYVSDIEQHEAKLIYAIDHAYILDGMKRYDDALTIVSQAEDMLALREENQASRSKLNLLKLKSRIFRKQGKFQSAYEVQSQYLKNYIKRKETENSEVIQSLRLGYESEHINVEKNLLEDKKILQSLALKDVNSKLNTQYRYLLLMLVLGIIFAWLLFRMFKSKKRLTHEANADKLTGVINRHRLMELGESLFNHSEDKKLSVLIIDVDHFKRINNSLGYKIGDEVLKNITDICRSALQESHAVRNSELGRYEGTKFVVLLPVTDEKEVINIAQGLRQQVNKFTWQHIGLDEVSISIGLATFDKSKHEYFEVLLKEADNKLYQVKDQG